MANAETGLGQINPANVSAFEESLHQYGQELQTSFSVIDQAQPEDQLKGPVSELIKAAGLIAGIELVTRTETRVDGIGGRPDIGINTDSLPIGNVELKAPGVGALPDKFRDRRNREQFARFKRLPNLLYTDGQEWALFRSGEMVGQPVKLSGDPTVEGSAAVGALDTIALLDLLGKFLQWEPVVPTTPRALAQMLAPLARLLKDEVLTNLGVAGPIQDLATIWRDSLFPDANDEEFADGYAQTFTYALLLARLEGASSPLTAEGAARELNQDHALLAQALLLLGHPNARDEIGLPVSLLERVIGAVDAKRLSSGRDPWLYFYEDFLAEYDPAQRNNRGVYYTPFEVVHAQVRSTQRLLVDQIGKPSGFADPDVVTIDPAVGTGTYPLAAVQHSLNEAASRLGDGIRSEFASRLVHNVFAFELLVGPYAVTHLRLSRTFAEAGADIPPRGVHVYLTDTLAKPLEGVGPDQGNIFKQRLIDEQVAASDVKRDTTLATVVIGNPPWDRDESQTAPGIRRKGGMVRYGDDPDSPGLIRSFLEPMSDRDRRDHALNLYNDYVYFWRWAIWKACEQHDGAAIVSLITPKAFLSGPGFSGMREVMRRSFDEIYFIDLGGTGRGFPRDDNVFDGVRTPSVITTAVRYGGTRAACSQQPARSHFRRIEGTKEQKLQTLDALHDLRDSEWLEVSDDWQASFMPCGTGSFFEWPLISEVLPWSGRGIQFSRTWPVGESEEVVRRRWDALLAADPTSQQILLRETGDTKASMSYRSFLGSKRLKPIWELSGAAEPDGVARISFRSFDRQWCIADRRVIDRPRPKFWAVRSPKQIYFTTLTEGLSGGPALIANTEVPDINAFNNRGGIVMPLWRDAQARDANVSASVLNTLTIRYGQPVSAEAVASYMFGLLGTEAYTERFSDELVSGAARIPFTADFEMFQTVSAFGQELLWSATFGERCLPPLRDNESAAKPAGTARNTVAVGPDYPESFRYEPQSATLHVGDGEFGPVSQQVWDFQVSGLPVIDSWLGYRMRVPAGRSSSPLDGVRPERWSFSEDLVEVLGVVEHLVARTDTARSLLSEVLEGPLLNASEFPPPLPEEVDPEIAVIPQPVDNALFLDL